MGENGINSEPHKGDEDHVAAYQTTNTSSDWQVTGNNLINTSSIGIDSFCPTVWDTSVNGHNLGYFDTQNIASTSNSLNNPVRGGMNWNPNTMLRNSVFLPTAQGLLPRNLPHFPDDTGFIERAARFSCFSGGNLGEMMNPFSFPDSLNHYFRSLGAVYGPNEAFGDHGLKPLNVSDVANDVSLGGVCGNESSPFKNKKKTVSHVRSHDEAKRGVNVSGNESDEAEYSGRNAKEELDGAQELSDKGLGSNKRKRTGQDLSEPKENNEGQQTSVEKGKSTSEFKEKDEQNSPSTGKSGGKNSKQVPQESDPPKEDYIHIRARRGQATNSHSLAERVRREKISERMKFLQDLVPGCNKVTGKAVMLDEIINYVQSLQRQVEFLSMKLATVNPRLDINIERFLAKNILQARAGLSSSMAFHPHDMTLPFPPPHPSLMQADLPSLATSSETLRRPINLQPSAISGGFKEHTSQMSNSAWEDELHNIVHIGFNSAAALSNQDLCASQLPRHMKPEP